LLAAQQIAEARVAVPFVSHSARCVFEINGPL
jgi:hypothetical protein